MPPSPPSWQSHLPHPENEAEQTFPGDERLLRGANRERGNRATLSTVRLCGGEERNWFEQAAAPAHNPNRVMRHRGLSETLAKVREE